MRVVSGKVFLDGWRGELGPATVYIRLLDTSLLDAPARRVAELVLHNVRLDQVAGEGLEFGVSTTELDANIRYELGVLVDLDGDGKTSAGDYINTQAYPVLTQGFPDRVDVQVRPVG